jgi:hypothetical protein
METFAVIVSIALGLVALPFGLAMLAFCLALPIGAAIAVWNWLAG